MHAASCIRRRRVVFDAALRSHPGELARIAVHEVFHFVWVRLNNSWRQSWSELLARENCRGELGWSSQWRKQRLAERRSAGPTRAWREYACESFCDTAAWLFSGVERHEEYSLGAAERAVRRGWFRALVRSCGGHLRI